jgi:hypothetical protein
MQIVIELTETQVEALQSLLSTQVEQVPNPVTGSVMMKPKYNGIQGFVMDHVGQVVTQAMRMYPPASVQADIQVIKEAEARISEFSKPTIAVSAIEKP